MPSAIVKRWHVDRCPGLNREVVSLASDTAEWHGIHFLVLATLNIATLLTCCKTARLD